MAAVVIVTGGSGGIGAAVCRQAPHGARLLDISRSGGTAGTEHVKADLADPRSWPDVGAAIAEAVADAAGDRTVFVQAAGTLTPIGYAGEVDADAYLQNVLVNSAAAQVLGHHYLAATREVAGRHQLCVLSSGAASSTYPGWSSYCAAKAATDHWVRTVGQEQSDRGGVEVCAIAPGVVDTGMQEAIRATNEADFPRGDKFRNLHEQGQLSEPDQVATQLWEVLDEGLEPGTVLDLRKR